MYTLNRSRYQMRLLFLSFHKDQDDVLFLEEMSFAFS